MLVAPDIERVLLDRVYSALKGKYADLFVSRTAPADISGRRVILLHQEGGVSRSPLLGQPQLVVDVYAPTESDVMAMAIDVQAVLNATRGHSPVISVDASGPSPIVGEGKGPQRRIYADALVRNINGGVTQ